MPHLPSDNLILASRRTQHPAGKSDFIGFAPPTSNTTYTPNQFFDVCLPNASRGCVRLVAYLIRKTLGWCDAQGNPQHEQIEVSYTDLERKAGVGHDSIRAALDEALAMNFIECVREGRARRVDDAGEAARYALKWDATPRYARSLDDFQGFYEGEGHRTDIPNQFFDVLIPSETLSVIKVTGAVIRYSIGFVAKRGHRRQQATLSYGQILQVSGLSSRRSLAGAIREAIAKNFIVRLDPGYFSARVSERRSATYAVRWSDGFHGPFPVGQAESAITPKRIPAGVWTSHSEKDTSESADHSVLETSKAPKRIPADHSEKDTIEITPLNEKQKQAAELLRKEGFEARTAEKLSKHHPLEVIELQVRWLPERNATKSRTGLLRRAIEGDWAEPASNRKGQREETGRDRAASVTLPDLPLDPAYLSWLAEQETAYRHRFPSEYDRFTAKRERRRADLLSERSADLRRRLVEQHDSEPGRLADFQRFLALPDSRTWAATINNQSPHFHS